MRCAPSCHPMFRRCGSPPPVPHRAAAASKKFPFSTFYVLIHHYWHTLPNIDSLFPARRSSPSTSWYWWGSSSPVLVGRPKGHSLLLLRHFGGHSRDLTGISLTFFSRFLLLLGRGRFGGWRSSWSCDRCSCCCCCCFCWRSLSLL